VTCLRICRAGLSTNFHGFGMMILFSLIQFTTFAILNLNYQTLTNDQSLYEDLFITFPIFITLNLTQPATTLSKELPPNSFFSLRNVLSMCGQLIIQFLVQLGFILYVLSLNEFSQERLQAQLYYMQNGSFQVGSSLSLALFVLSNNIYLGIVLSTSVSKPFRKPFYTNPFYTINLILLWCYNTFLVIFPKLSPSEMRSKNLSEESEFILVMALLVGNLTMVIMYLYENLLVFLWSKENPCLKRKVQQEEQYPMDDAIK
jgi:magnesium-transporting ATPase (P-type)